MKKLFLYFHTLKHLKWIQIQYRLFYLLRGKWRRFTGFKQQLIQKTPPVQKLVLNQSIPSYPTYLSNNTFRFLNLEKDFDKKIDWNYANYGKLWTYNLNYFEFLNQPAFPKDEGINLINQYIDNFGQLKDGLEPFPISLRTINWIKFLNETELPTALDQKIYSFLYTQIKILKNHLEYHLLGNHLLENGFALLFGAFFFKDISFLKHAEKILRIELEEQILNDGAHFELSPMYHQLMLYRLLDVTNLMQNNPSIFQNHLLHSFRKKAKKMLGWLHEMTFSNGEIPLFNDSAFNIAPTTKDLIQYASSLNIYPERISLQESGYRKLTNSIFEIIIDIGQIGPQYVPGHSHCDMLSFILYKNNKPIIIDTGISTYDKNNQRNVERSTCSHNTVTLNNQNQSQIWGGFRVAKRARPIIIKETNKLISASHTGYKDIKAHHERVFELRDRDFIIKDYVRKENSNQKINSVCFIHFHPDITISVKGNKLYSKDFIIEFDFSKSIEFLNFDYCLSFNKKVPSLKVKIVFDDKLITTFKSL